MWTDAATVIRIDGTSGSTEYTKTVPYQIPVAVGRDLGSPDLHRLTEELNFQSTGSGTSYFTDLGTGATRAVSGGIATGSIYCYDGQTATLLGSQRASHT